MDNSQGFGNNGNVRVGKPIGNHVNIGNTGNIVNVGNMVNVGQPGLIRS